MKPLFFLLLAIMTIGAFSPPTQAQTARTGASRVPYSDGLQAYGQGFNVLSTYYNIPTALTISQGTPVLDTGTNATPFTISIAGLFIGIVNADTFNVFPLNGTGDITLSVVVLKCTGSPTVTVTAYQSPDGFNWAPVPSVTTATIVPTSLTSSAASTVTLTFKKTAKYYYVNIGGSSSSTYSAQLFWYYQKNVVYNPSPPHK